MGPRSPKERGNFSGCPPHWKASGGFATVYAETAEPIEMPFGGLTHVGPSKHVLDRGQGRTNPFASARGDKTAMRPLVKLCYSKSHSVLIGNLKLSHRNKHESVLCRRCIFLYCCYIYCSWSGIFIVFANNLISVYFCTSCITIFVSYCCLHVGPVIALLV